MSSHRLTIPVFIHALALAMALCLWAMPAAAYVNLLPEQVKDMVDGQADVTFIDVREPIDFCTQLGGHVPCSLNYPWNSGVLTNNYTDFDSRAPIVVICMTGQRSLKSAQFLESVGFTDVSLMQGGMLDWQWQTETCNEVCPACVSPSCPPLYFAHIDTSAGWTTGLTIVNTGTAQAEGQLKAYDALGSLVDTRQVALAPDGRASFDVAADFADPQDIRYAILESDALGLVGYATFAQPGGSAVSLAAVRHGSTGSLVLPHVPTDGGWWTGLALVNPGSEAVEYIIRFNDGTAVNRILYPGRHEAFTLAQLLGEAPSADMQNAVLEGAGGLVALALYGQTENGALSGLSLNTPRLKEIYLPHVTDDAQWWTGLVACNYGTTDATLNILSYDAAGNQLANSARILAAGRTLVGTAQTLGLPENTAWCRIQSTELLAGFELFGNQTTAQLAGLPATTCRGTYGCLPAAGDPGTTGVVLVNSQAATAQVALAVRNAAGVTIATTNLAIGRFAKAALTLADLFPGQDLSTAASVSYTADRQLLAFELLGAGGGTALEAIPSLR